MFKITRVHSLHAYRPIVSRRSASTTPPKFFSDGKHAEFLAAAVSSTSIPALHGLPEVIVAGRANVGKSTLLNAVLNRRDLLHTSKKPGRTRSLNFYKVGPPPGKLVLVDAPGYGERGRPEWGELFDCYLDNRSQLRRVYLLVNARHGLNAADKEMLQYLDDRCQSSSGTRWTIQTVITKADTALDKQSAGLVSRLEKQIFDIAPVCLPPIVTSMLKHPYFGLDNVRNSIAQACFGT
ncbi:hypothetical protein JAAARDRAFT_165071 [Jaapia argillacea MUCL 33604]|uniref:EngB-type G domain-containing protein n=1 Tax=Jaapia argillacea MUCL 33604 TaxID=933084 RepID=A0A067P5T7_9AGAM|nr:hypothetical protein JAAARDRAFT_165071 [Jaapia argillacea MUCL 33604]